MITWENTEATKEFIRTHGRVVVRKPNPVYIVELGDRTDHQVVTNEGVMGAKLPGYVALDPQTGRIWPIDQEYLDLHYEDPSPVPSQES